MNGVPTCKHHPHAKLKLVDAAVPMFGNSVSPDNQHRRIQRKIYRCPHCPFCAPGPSQSELTAFDRTRYERGRYVEMK
jgi:predicted RNA-binding Zn-ribbon protein involved in translation (DUF1610 family)